MLPSLNKPTEKTDKSFITSYVSLTPMKDKTKNVKLDERINTSNAILKKDSVQQLARPVSKKLTKIEADLKKLKAKVIAQVVMGKSTPDDGMKTYAAEAKNLGVDEVVTEMNSSK